MKWLYSIEDPLWETLVASVLIFIVIIVLTRIIGLRSFAKFTVFDFAFTVAIGSVLANILTSSTSVAHGSVAVFALLVLTGTASWIQRKFPAFDNAISNNPLLLMKGTEFIEENLEQGRIQRSQVIAKLREANVTNYNQIIAVVLETTGDISVLHHEDGLNSDYDERLFENVEE